MMHEVSPTGCSNETDGYPSRDLVFPRPLVSFIVHTFCLDKSQQLGIEGAQRSFYR